jgi:hypothetical protein
LQSRSWPDAFLKDLLRELCGNCRTPFLRLPHNIFRIVSEEIVPVDERQTAEKSL